MPFVGKRLAQKIHEIVARGRTQRLDTNQSLCMLLYLCALCTVVLTDMLTTYY